MLEVPAGFAAASDADKRHPTQYFAVSWNKSSSEDVTFFTIGESLIGGGDVIKPTIETLLLLDFYFYVNETQYVDGIEYERRYDRPVLGLSRAQATVTLRNHRSRFTPDYDPDIGEYVSLPKRPLFFNIGFKIPQALTIDCFKGYSLEQELDLKGRKVRVRAVDGMDAVYNYTFDAVVMWENKRTDEILVDIMEIMGVPDTMYEFDEGLNTIPFAWVNTNEKAGPFIKELCEAELGHFYFDETGKIRFENREHWDTEGDPVETITDDKIFDVKVGRLEDIINAVRITSEVRALQPEKSIWNFKETEVGGFSFKVPANDSCEYWASFPNPSKDHIEPLIDNPTTTSYFRANKEQGGEGDPVVSGVYISVFDGFATAAKMTFVNTNEFDVWIVEASIYGVPAEIVQEIDVRVANNPSIAKYGINLLPIENRFINSNELATDFGSFIVNTYGEAVKMVELDVRGKPQRQLGDLVEVVSDRIPGTIKGNIIGIQGVLERGKLGQKLQLLSLS